MKVSNEMVRRLSERLEAVCVHANDQAVRGMLESVLAEEPQSEGVAELVRRLTHAQMKLERIRELRISDPRLKAILEEP